MKEMIKAIRANIEIELKKISAFNTIISLLIDWLVKTNTHIDKKIILVNINRQLYDISETCNKIKDQIDDIHALIDGR